MVKNILYILAAVCLLLGCLLAGCTNDLAGLFRSTDLNTRLKEQNNFKFLQPADRTLSLGDKYSFIVITDTHILNEDDHDLEKKLKGVIDADSEIKFVVITGDITQRGDRQEIKKFIEIANSLGIPCYPVVGNHDIFFGNWPEWKSQIGSTRYRIDGDGTTFFILDSANAYFGKDQLDWLEQEIKKAQGRVFIFSHANIFMQNPAELQQFTDTRERARLISMLHNRCDAMFMGHSHQRLVKEVGGVQYICIEDYRDKRIYCRVSVSETTGVSWEFLRL